MMSLKHRSLVSYGFVALLVLLFDRVSKWYVVQHVQAPIEINPFLSFELAFNRGISWGMFHGSSSLMFAVVTIIISIVTFFVAVAVYAGWRENEIVLGEIMVVAGSIGNLIDRAWYGGVVDFILLHYRDWHWPLFNIADMAIVCGVAIMIGEYYRS